jgi:hypothetical protein
MEFSAEPCGWSYAGLMKPQQGGELGVGQPWIR